MPVDSESLLVELLAANNAVWTASRPFFSRFDISESHFNVLNILAFATQPLSQRELSDQLLTDKSAVTGLIDRMERKELLRRKASPKDRRVYHLQLTPKGRALWQRIRPHYLKEIDRLFANLPKSKREEFHQHLLAIKKIALDASVSDKTAKEETKAS